MARITTGQVALNGTTQQVSATQIETAYWTLKARVSNAGPVAVGLAGVTLATGYLLEPGEELQYDNQRVSGENIFDTNISDVFVQGTNGDTVSWLAHRV